MLRRRRIILPPTTSTTSSCLSASTSTSSSILGMFQQQRNCSSSSSLTNNNNSTTMQPSSSSSSSSIIPPSSFEVSSSVSESTLINPRHIELRSTRVAPTDPAAGDKRPIIRIAQSFKQATQTVQPEERFTRKEGDPSMYHDVSPENLKFLYEAERDELAQEEDAIYNNRAKRQEEKSDEIDGGKNQNPFFEQDVPYFSKSLETQSYTNREGILRNRSHAFLGREGDHIRQQQKREEYDALHPEQLDDPFASATKIFANKKANKALATERAFQQVLDSTASEQHKANVALDFVAKLQKQNLPIRSRLVEEVFALWARVTQQNLIDADSKAAEEVRTQHLLEKQEELLLDAKRRKAQRNNNNNDNASGELERDEMDLKNDYNTQPKQYEAATTYFQPMTNLYFHMRKHFTAPTPLIFEHYMTILHIASKNEPNKEIMDIASRLMLDSDQFTVLPSRITLASYFDICSLNGKMNLALIKMADCKDVLHINADAGMVRSIVSGLVKNGMVSEALAFLARTSAVHVDVTFLNSIMELLSLSPDPMSSFTAFKALEASGIRPNSTTFFHLLRACEASGHWEEGTPLVLASMQNLRIKGDDTTLNLLLKGLVLCSRTHGYQKYAHQLYFAMKQKNIQVFEEVEQSLPENIQEKGAKLQRLHVMKKRDLRFTREGDLVTAEDYLIDEHQRQENIKKNAGRLTMEEEDGGKDSLQRQQQDSEVLEKQEFHKQQLMKRRAAEDEEFLRRLAAEDRLAPKMVRRHRRQEHHQSNDNDDGTVDQQQQHTNNNINIKKSRDGEQNITGDSNSKIAVGGAPLLVMCRFGLRKYLGNPEDQELMKRYIELKSKQSFQRRKIARYDDEDDDDKRNEAVVSEGHKYRSHKLLDEINDEIVRVGELLKPKMWRYVHKHFYGVLPVSTRVVDMRVSRRREYVRKMKERSETRRRRSEDVTAH